MLSAYFSYDIQYPKRYKLKSYTNKDILFTLVLTETILIFLKLRLNGHEIDLPDDINDNNNKQKLHTQEKTNRNFLKKFKNYFANFSIFTSLNFSVWNFSIFQWNRFWIVLLHFDKKKKKK